MEKKPITNLIDRLFGKVLTIREYHWVSPLAGKQKWSINGFEISGPSAGTIV